MRNCSPNFDAIEIAEMGWTKGWTFQQSYKLTMKLTDVRLTFCFTTTKYFVIHYLDSFISSLKIKIIFPVSKFYIYDLLNSRCRIVSWNIMPNMKVTGVVIVRVLIQISVMVSVFLAINLSLIFLPGWFMQ